MQDTELKEEQAPEPKKTYWPTHKGLPALVLYDDIRDKDGRPVGVSHLNRRQRRICQRELRKTQRKHGITQADIDRFRHENAVAKVASLTPTERWEMCERLAADDPEFARLFEEMKAEKAAREQDEKELAAA